MFLMKLFARIIIPVVWLSRVVSFSQVVWHCVPKLSELAKLSV